MMNFSTRWGLGFTGGCILSFLLLGGCYNHVDLQQPIIWEVDDRRPIDDPQEETEGQWVVWDGTHKMIFYRVGQFLNLGRTFRMIGEWVGLADPVEAGNVNVLDEVPNSTWFTNRHFFSRLTPEELRRGSTTGNPPDTGGEWVVISAKESLGSTPGFVIRDSKGDVYLIKFDSPLNPEMTTASELITPRFLFAAGYNVPEHYLVTVDPTRLVVDPKAKIRGKYRRRVPMTETDVQNILDRVPHRPDGTIRAIASKYLPGIPKGPFLYEGRRPDDPHDTIYHENRRELRGLGVLAAFLNHTDTKAANALDMYDPKKKYLTHYLIDFSSTLGADNADPQLPRYGNEYFLDFPSIGLSSIAFGGYVKPWEILLPMEYPSVGYFNAEYFDPSRWRPTFPNPAFLRMTLRDAYWGAKIVASFTDQDIDTIVKAGAFTHLEAERYVADVLKKRRDKIGRYYFNLVNPLDRFILLDQDSHRIVLGFENLALTCGYAPSHKATYRYTVTRHVSYGYDALIIPETIINNQEISLDGVLEDRLENRTSSAKAVGSGKVIAYISIETSYDEGKQWSQPVHVYLGYDLHSKQFQIKGIQRET